MTASLDPIPDVDTTAGTAVGTVAAILAIVFVAFRCHMRHRTEAGFDWDDWLILGAFAASIGVGVALVYASRVSADDYTTYASSGELLKYDVQIVVHRVTYIGTTLYFSIISATKLSILLMYRRLFSINSGFRRQVGIVSWIVIMFWIGCTVAELLVCIPLERTWTKTLDTAGHCHDFSTFWLVSGIVESALDTTIVALPLGIIYRLQINRKSRYGLMGVFSLVIFVLVCDVLKVANCYVPEIHQPSMHTLIWAVAHSCTGIVCACLPICWPLLVRFGRLLMNSLPIETGLKRRWNDFHGWSLLRGDKSDADIEARLYELPD